MALVVSGGERHESQYLNGLLDTAPVRRPTRGRPRIRPRHLVGDKGYSYHAVRIATRYEKCAALYMAMLTLAALRLWL